MLIVLLPILTEAFEVEAQEMGGQIRRVTLGREQGKASIAGHEVTPRVALSVGPADPSITWAQMESGAGPAEQGDPSAVLFGDIAEGLPHHTMLLEVMLLSDQFVPASLFLRANQLHTDFFSDDFPESFPNQMLRTGCGTALGWTNHEGSVVAAEKFVQSKNSHISAPAPYGTNCRSRG